MHRPCFVKQQDCGYQIFAVDRKDSFDRMLQVAAHFDARCIAILVLDGTG